MSILRDVLAVGGLAALLYGGWLVHPALSWIGGGATVFGLSVWWSWRARK